MVIFHSYVSLPEGRWRGLGVVTFDSFGWIMSRFNYVLYWLHMFVCVGGLPSRGRLEWKLLVAGTHILIKMDESECVSKHFFTYIYIQYFMFIAFTYA